LFFLVWVTPMVAFYTIIHIGDPGYVFTFLPAIIVLLGAFLARPALANTLRCNNAAGSVVSAAVILANAGVFLFHPRPMTAQGIGQNDRDYREKIEFIQTQVEPGSTILLSYDSYKHLLYYLPEYRQSIWVDIFADAGGQVRIPAGVKSILLVDARLAAIDKSQPLTRELRLPSGGKMYLIAATAGQTLTVGGKSIEIHD
ncbi:MAG: hypothetical protein Q7O66_22910, partial [Dehalococcoidia bacterium]|nr:hypothetical protein [Dehalococcoidia bacterium]